ncbi:MAG TPA: CHAP domain-containing protein [Solirubrobacteraceae bacterium]|nr:CHAP domain-containing protein [Solirubrobacteraceae bacterium]
MTRSSTPVSTRRSPGLRRSLPAWARPAAVVALILVLGGALGAGPASADPAPQQWLPTAADLVRTLRPCTMAVGAPTLPVCWSITEDGSAWMAQPAGSPYPWGQCTYYAGLMRPDIWNDRAPPAADPLYDDWDAWTWVEHARAEGLSVDGDPRPGDVMVYSRPAVGNAVGHVAIVDAVDRPDPATGNLELTISEMNVDGLDDAALGQGDTLTLVVARGQVAPGLIQFIHRPPPGYVAPAWPAGGGTGYAAVAATATATATPSPASADPSLSVSLVRDRLETVSESTAPVQVTVTAVPGGAVVERLTVTANRVIPLRLPGGTYRVCVRQDPSDIWPAVGGCATAAWTGPSARLTLTAGRLLAGGSRLMLLVTMRGMGAAGAEAGAPLTAVMRLVVPGIAGGRRRVSVRRRLRLRFGEQALRLPAVAGSALRGTTVTLVVPSQMVGGVRVAAVRISRAV